MSDVAIPSYRVARPKEAPPWRMLAIAGGLVGAAALGGAIAWGLADRGAPTASRDVPLIQAEQRPVKVRPDNPGGMQVLNTDQLVLDSPAARRAAERQVGSQQRVLAEPEAPNADAMRPPTAPPMAALPPPVPIAPTTPAPAAAPPPPAIAFIGNGRSVVQLGALVSEEAAKTEWARLQKRVPELAGRPPQILRFEQDGRTLWRLRTGGLADANAARALCESVRARGGACMPVGG